MNDLRARLRLPLKIIEVGDLRWIEDATGGAVPLDSVIDAINGDTSLYVPSEPTYEMLKALAGNPVLLAASDEAELRRRYKAMVEAAWGGK